MHESPENDQPALVAVDGRPELIPVRSAHRFDEARLERYLHRNVPEIHDPITVSQFQGGQSNPTYLITSGEQSFVLRKRPPGTLLASAHAIEREYRVMRALAGGDVPVPRMYHLCQDEEVIGQAFYVMQYLDGRVFTDVRLASSSLSERAAIYDSMNAALAALHAVDFRAAGLEEFGRPSGYIKRQISRWSKQYVASEVDECDEMNRLMTWLADHAPERDEAAIAHGDFRLGNLLFDPQKPIVIGVLDWELSTIGHPLADLAYNCQMYHLGEPDGAPPTFPPGIPTETDYLGAYCRRVGRDAPADWEFYLAFSFFRSAAILAGVYRRGLSGNAADRTAIERGRLYSHCARVGWGIAQGRG